MALTRRYTQGLSYACSQVNRGVRPPKVHQKDDDRPGEVVAFKDFDAFMAIITRQGWLEVTVFDDTLTAELRNLATSWSSTGRVIDQTKSTFGYPTFSFVPDPNLKFL